VPARVRGVELGRRVGKLTSWGRGLGVREQHNAALAFLHELGKRRLGALVRLDFAAKRGQVNRVANLGRAANLGRIASSSGGRGFAVGAAGDGLLDGLDSLSDGLSDGLGRLLDDRLVSGSLFAPGSSDLLGWAHWRRGRRLALAEFDHGWDGIDVSEGEICDADADA
jgi:hypothetical protein